MSHNMILDSLDETNSSLKDPAIYISEIEKFKNKGGFPVESFPLPIQKFIRETHRCLNFPIEFIGSSLISVAAIMIGNTYKVEVMKGWTEKAVIYMALVGRPGTTKSPALKFALKPIMNIDKDSFKKYNKEKLKFEAADLTTKPIFKKILVSDATQEAIVKVHQDNPTGVGVYVDELSGWLGNFDKYSHSKGGDEGFYLSNWSDGYVNKDRTNTQIFIPNSAISVVGTIQPGLIQNIFSGHKSLNGFVDRILWVIPEDQKVKEWSERQLNDGIADYWSTTVRRLNSLRIRANEEIEKEEFNGDVSKTLKFTTEAFQLLKKFQSELASECNQLNNDVKRGIYRKLETYCIRLALIFEILHTVCAKEDPVPNLDRIGSKSVRSAIATTKYYKSQADKFHAMVSDDSGLEKLPSNHRLFYDTLGDKSPSGEYAPIITKSAVNHGLKYNISERTVKRMLNNRKLFHRMGHGKYEKLL